MQTLHSKAPTLQVQKYDLSKRTLMCPLYEGHTKIKIWQLKKGSVEANYDCGIPFFTCLFFDVFLSTCFGGPGLHPLSPHSLCNWLKDFHLEYQFPPGATATWHPP